MKHAITEPTNFKPVILTITFENQKELDAIGTLFNSGPISDALTKVFGVGTGSVYESFSKAGARIDGVASLQSKLKEIL